MTIHLKENWLEYDRFLCKEGHIDMWRGDCANNPNNDEKANHYLNAGATYYRLNGTGKWIIARLFFGESLFHVYIQKHQTEKNAIEIWKDGIETEISEVINRVLPEGWTQDEVDLNYFTSDNLQALRAYPDHLAYWEDIRVKPVIFRLPVDLETIFNG